MELLQVIEPQPGKALMALVGMLISKPPTIPSNAEPYRAPNGIWFWAVPSTKETKQ